VPDDKLTVIEYFNTIAEGDLEESSHFDDLTLEHDDLAYPPVYDIHGEQVMLYGPMQVNEILRRRKIRLVRVQFTWVNGLSRYSEFGIQGENQIIHLITESSRLFMVDPMPSEPNDEVAHQIAKNMRGIKEAWDAIA
jgi:hypothetical protein